MTPLRIEWRLRTGWCPPDFAIHLDARLARVMVEDALADGTFTSFEETLANLPFERHQASETGQWVWKASMLIPEAPFGMERRHMTARTDIVPMALAMAPSSAPSDAEAVQPIIAGKPMTIIDTSRGAYKNASLYYTIQHVERVVAFCVGDIDRIGPLLSRVHSIGKRTRLGHGEVASFDVVEDVSAHDRWQYRYMPEPVEGYVPVTARLRPPYWQGEGAVMAWRPIGIAA